MEFGIAHTLQRILGICIVASVAAAVGQQSEVQNDTSNGWKSTQGILSPEIALKQSVSTACSHAFQNDQSSCWIELEHGALFNAEQIPQHCKLQAVGPLTIKGNGATIDCANTGRFITVNPGVGVVIQSLTIKRASSLFADTNGERFLEASRSLFNWATASHGHKRKDSLASTLMKEYKQLEANKPSLSKATLATASFSSAGISSDSARIRANTVRNGAGFSANEAMGKRFNQAAKMSNAHDQQNIRAKSGQDCDPNSGDCLIAFGPDDPYGSQSGALRFSERQISGLWESRGCQGGAIYGYPGSRLELFEVSFEGCQSCGGGAISAFNSTLHMSAVRFNACTAAQHGPSVLTAGGAVLCAGAQSNVTLHNSTVEDCHAEAIHYNETEHYLVTGGGIALVSVHIYTVSDVFMQGNTVGFAGGIRPPGVWWLPTPTTFNALGGAIFVLGNNPTSIVRDVVTSHNAAVCIGSNCRAAGGAICSMGLLLGIRSHNDTVECFGGTCIALGGAISTSGMLAVANINVSRAQVSCQSEGLGGGWCSAGGGCLYFGSGTLESTQGTNIRAMYCQSLCSGRSCFSSGAGLGIGGYGGTIMSQLSVMHSSSLCQGHACLCRGGGITVYPTTAAFDNVQIYNVQSACIGDECVAMGAGFCVLDGINDVDDSLIINMTISNSSTSTFGWGSWSTGGGMALTAMSVQAFNVNLIDNAAYCLGDWCHSLGGAINAWTSEASRVFSFYKLSIQGSIARGRGQNCTLGGGGMYVSAPGIDAGLINATVIAVGDSNITNSQLHCDGRNSSCYSTGGGTQITGVYATFINITIANCMIKSDSASDQNFKAGGGLYCISNEIRVVRAGTSLFLNNSVLGSFGETSLGGAAAAMSGCHFAATDSQFVLNSATGKSGQGGAVAAQMSIRLNHCQFHNNSAGAQGGALHLVLPSQSSYFSSISHCRGQENSAQVGNTILLSTSSDVSFEGNSFIASFGQAMLVTANDGSQVFVPHDTFVCAVGSEYDWQSLPVAGVTTASLGVNNGFPSLPDFQIIQSSTANEIVQCRPCPNGFFSLKTASFQSKNVCKRCPLGANCVNGSIEATAGWWMMLAASDNGAPDVYLDECPVPSLCTGGPVSAQCAEGTMGQFCSECQPGWSATFGGCVNAMACRQTQPFVWLSVPVLAIIYAAWAMKRQRSGVMMSVLAYFQILAGMMACGMVQGDAAAFSRSAVMLLGLSIPIGSDLGICVVQSERHDLLIAAASGLYMMFFVSALLAVPWLRKLKNHVSDQALFETDNSQSSSILRENGDHMFLANGKRSRWSLVHVEGGALCSIIFIVWSGMLGMWIGAVTCRYTPDGSLWWRGAGHCLQSWQVGPIVGIALFSSFPLLAAYACISGTVMSATSDAVTHFDHSGHWFVLKQQVLEWFTKPFHNRCRAWIAVLLIRPLFLHICGAAFSDAVGRAVSATACILSFTVLTCVMQPWKSPLAFSVDVFGLGTSTIAGLFGVAQSSVMSAGLQPPQWTISGQVAICLSVSAVMLLVSSFMLSRSMFRQLKRAPALSVLIAARRQRGSAKRVSHMHRIEKSPAIT